MHNNYIHKVLLILFLSATGISNAQFNTLNYKKEPEEEKENKNIIDIEKDTNSFYKENNKPKGFFKRLFSSEKEILRREIDSLKKIIKKNEKKILTKQIEDSITLKIFKKLFLEDYPLKKEKIVNEQKTKIAMPLKGNLQITSFYGMRKHPISLQNKMHYGIDLKANNEFIYAVLDGIISEQGWDNKSGFFIKVKHKNNFESTYCHLSETYYKEGENVKAGFIIGKSGNTGLSTAPHLHFSVKEDEKYINPTIFLKNLIEKHQ